MSRVTTIHEHGEWFTPFINMENYEHLRDLLIAEMNLLAPEKKWNVYIEDIEAICLDVHIEWSTTYNLHDMNKTVFDLFMSEFNEKIFLSHRMSMLEKHEDKLLEQVIPHDKPHYIKQGRNAQNKRVFIATG